MKRPLFLLFWVLLTAFLSVGYRSDYQSTKRIRKLNNIYWYDNTLILCDPTNGLHLYSMENPTTPRYRSTIAIEKMSGVAMKDSVIYADTKGSIVAYKLKSDFTADTICTIYANPYYYYWEGDDIMRHRDGYSPFGCSGPAASDVASSPIGGAGGSYATFAIIDTFLYYISQGELISVSISHPDSIHEIGRTTVDWGIETLFPTEEFLYLGGTMGMYVLSRSNPAQPEHIGTMQHFKACDPVVVRDTLAYVTLRAGNNCGETRDALLAISLVNPASPHLLSETAAIDPFGLAIADSLLLVANGYKGMTFYSLSDPNNPQKVKTIKTFDAVDFIYDNDMLVLMGVDNVRIFTMDDPLNPVQTAFIE